MPLSPETRLGPYEIITAIGAGGMGEVYKARDTRLGRDVAIKVLPATLAAAAQFRDRFEREAKSISQLTHPNICTLHDVGRLRVSDADAASAKKSDDNSYVNTWKKGGKTTMTVKGVVSADGKTLTVTQTGTNTKGQAVNHTVVYNRQ